MSTRVDAEEIETTRSEKLLAAVLTVFLLIGLLWVYFHVDVDRDPGYATPPQSGASAVDSSALKRHERALDALRAAKAREASARRLLVDRREAYRTALDAGRRDAALERRYEAAQAAAAAAEARRRAARREQLASAPAARAAERHVQAASEREQARLDARRRHDERVSLARRLVLVLVLLAASYVLLGRLRRRRSRYLPAALAAVAAVALMALVMAVDYLTDYIEVTDLGVPVLSGAGVLMTLGAFAVLQRYLARRIPGRRVRRRECPFCGYPVADNRHCEGCGRDVIADCATCARPRRVGTSHCGACGAA
jgi:hypothetical protein